MLKRRADPGVPIRAIALFGQRGQQTFIALADSGIDSPRDWEGRTVGYRISLPPEYLAIVDAAGVNRELVQEVRVGFDPRILVQGRVDVLAVFKSNEPDTIRKFGFDVVQFDPSAYGVPALGLTYITREDLIAEEPELIARFLKAALKGLEFSFAHPEETVDIVLRYAENEDRDHMRFMLQAEQADAVSAVTREHGLGWMTRAAVAGVPRPAGALSGAGAGAGTWSRRLPRSSWRRHTKTAAWYGRDGRRKLAAMRS